jgi:quinol monooxygenase YgiN
MVIVYGYAKAKPGMLEGLQKLARQEAIDTRKDAGCLRFHFATDLVDSAVISIEKWESQAHLDAHMLQEHTKIFLSEVTKYFDEDPIMEFIRVGE